MLLQESYPAAGKTGSKLHFIEIVATSSFRRCDFCRLLKVNKLSELKIFRHRELTNLTISDKLIVVGTYSSVSVVGGSLKISTLSMFNAG
jgi:hypothetical protein